MKEYIELEIICTTEKAAEIATAFLADYPFDSFDTQPHEGRWLLRGYILAESWAECRDEALSIAATYGDDVRERSIEDENWNVGWESENFRCVEIDDIMVIRPSNTPAPTNPSVIDIVVAPQMSFGSGHHNTTRMMCRLIHRYPCRGAMLDVGCGTGVLSIAALKCGARSADAVDIDPWSIESTRNAAELNGLTASLRPILGTVEKIEGCNYDMVAANIMRNIIVADMSRYYAALNTGGRLLLSGFLEEDYDAVKEAAEGCGLSFMDMLYEDGWVAAIFEKR